MRLTVASKCIDDTNDKCEKSISQRVKCPEVVRVSLAHSSSTGTAGKLCIAIVLLSSVALRQHLIMDSFPVVSISSVI